jgi:hypothetical protein
MKTLSAALAALFLTACGTAAAPTVTVTAPASTVTAAAPVPAPKTSSTGEEIRSLLATQGMTYGGPASQLEEVADSVCEALDNGISLELLVRVAMDSGFSMEEGATIVAASIVVVCPRHRSVT